MKGFKTIAFNAVSILVMSTGTLLVYVDQLPITDGQAAIIGIVATIIVNIGNMWLRSVTNTKMGFAE